MDNAKVKRSEMAPNSRKRKLKETEKVVIELKTRLQVFGQLRWLVLARELWEAMRFCRITAGCL